MPQEGLTFEKKSLRLIQKQNPDWTSLSESCVAFANTEGGLLWLGVEDNADAPTPEQSIPADLPKKIRRRILGKTVNVEISIMKQTADNGGEFVEITVSRSLGTATTTGGRVIQRRGDKNVPVAGEHIADFVLERESERKISWESAPAKGAKADPDKLSQLTAALKKSGRMHPATAEKSSRELMEHYGLSESGVLTNLGVLCVGDRAARARLSSFKLQCLQFDNQDNRVQKWAPEYGNFGEFAAWELPDAVLRKVPVFREIYEVPDGAHRREFPVFPGEVVRELLVNALVHRPYTRGGDIFVNLRPNGMAVVNPGALPLGITPANILHKSARHNPRMADLFEDLGLMENEGSGFDKMYEILLSQGRPAPQLSVGQDRVEVFVARRPPSIQIVALMDKVGKALELSQRERIALGLLARGNEMKVAEFASSLGIESGEMENWTGRLLTEGILQAAGRRGTQRLFVPPELFQFTDILFRPLPLVTLILEVLARHPNSSRGEIRAKIGGKFSRHQIGRTLADLKESGKIQMTGNRGSARYHIALPLH